MLVTVDDVVGIFPRPLDDDERERAANLVDAALDLIEEAFLRRGRDFYAEADGDRLLGLTVKRVVREMVSEAVHVGDSVGKSSVSSTTGPQSDSITWSQGVGIRWGGVYLSDEWLRDLGLLESGTVFNFPRPNRYGGSAWPSGAEFSERPRWGL